MRKFFIFFILLIFFTEVAAVEDYYPFKTKEEKNRFYQLTSQLRCLVCQNQNLAESNAGLANDLRDQIYQKILQGQSNQEIVTYLVSRYGNFVLYDPPLNLATLLLWFGPLCVLVFSLGYLIFY